VDIDGRPGKVKRFGGLLLHILVFLRFLGKATSPPNAVEWKMEAALTPRFPVEASA